MDYGGQEFIGSVAFRFQSDPEIEKYCGHVGVAVRKEMQNKGYAQQAMTLTLDVFRDKQMLYVLYTTSADNVPSARLVKSLGGYHVEHFDNPMGFGPTDLYRIDL